MKRPPGIRRLTTPRQLEAIGSPLRQEILEHLGHAGQASVADLGRLMGRRPTALHYHVNLLRDAGLIREATRRRAGKRTEALYRLTASKFAVLARAREAGSDPGVTRALGAMLRLAQRDADRAIRSAAVVGEGPGRTLHLRRLRAPLSAASLRTVNQLLDRIEHVFATEVRNRTRHPARDAGAQILALTILLSPGAAAGSARKESAP